MPAALLLASLAHAATLHVDVTTPTSKPVLLTLDDPAPGRSYAFELPPRARRGAGPSLTVDVETSADPAYDWQITFTVAARARRHGAEPVVLTRPTMQAHTNERAEFSVGSATPVPGQDGMSTLDGYAISFVVTE